MEKHIARWSYFLGLAGVAIAVVWRLLTFVHLMPKEFGPLPHAISYKTLQQGAFMFFALAVATAAYVYTQREGK